MCFYHDDYDWCAEHEEQHFVREDSPAKCHECDRVVLADQWRRKILQQQYECCQICEDRENFDFISAEADDYDSNEEYAAALDELGCHECDYGERFACTICRECNLLLAAIYDLEQIEGCPEHARQPLYGELLRELEEDEEGKYVRHALRMFPELVRHPLIIELNQLAAEL